MASHFITGNGRANLIVSYDTPYNVSVVAGVCGRINASTTLMVNYGKHAHLSVDWHDLPPLAPLQCLHNVPALLSFYA